jgi:hypothetical protein
MCQRIVTTFLILTTLPAALFAQPLADRVPKDVLIYVGWAGSAGMGPSYDESHFKALLESSGMPKFIDDALPAVLQRIAEEDRSATEAIRIFSDLGRIVWKYPTAVFASGLGVRDGVPTPRVGVLCRAGADAETLETRVNDLLLQVSREIPLEIRTFRADDLVGVVVGYEASEFKPDTQGTLHAVPAFKEAIAQLQPEAALAVYIDADGLRRMGERMIAQFGDEEIRREWPTVRDAFGLDGLRQVAFTAGFRDKRWETNLFVGATAPRKGLLKLLDAEPVSDAAFKLIPRSARLAGAVSIDSKKILADIRSVVGQIDPRAKREFDEELADASKELGIDVEQDLLAHLGKEWAYYTAPTVGGNGLPGVVLVNRPADADKAADAMDKLADAVNRLIAEETRGEDVTVRIRETQAGDLRIKYLATPIVSPAWAVRDGNLYVAMYPQVVAAAAKAGKDAGSILDNPDFAALRKAMSGEKSRGVSSILFLDLPQTVPDAYPMLLPLSRLSGFADVLGIPAPAMLLPPIETLSQHVTPSASATWTDDAGWHWRSVSPFPGAELLAVEMALP